MLNNRLPVQTTECDEAILHAAIRYRTQRVSHLAEFLSLPEPEVRSALERLHSTEILSIVDDQIVYQSPTHAATSLLEKKLTAHMASLQQQLEEMAALTERFSVDTENSANIPTVDIMGSTVFRGAHAGQNALAHMIGQQAQRTSRDSFIFGMMPDPNPPQMSAHEQQNMMQHVSSADSMMRLLLPEPPIAVPESDLREYTPMGVDVRWFHRVPSWLWINTHTKEAAIPMMWGEFFPTTVIVFSHPVVYALAEELFLSCWRLGVPVAEAAEQAHWEPLLVLMRSGLTLEGAAARLGVTPRTARRRLDKAMQHFHVENMFSVGAAWAASLGGGSIPFPSSRASLL